MVKVRVELGGGVEQLFDKRKTFEVVLPAEVVTLAGLINHLATKVIKERPELFIAGDTIRPGIIVLVNDADWELEGHGAYVLREGDAIGFISTLHGG